MLFKFVDLVFYFNSILNMRSPYSGPIYKKTAFWNSIFAAQIVIFEFLAIILETSF